MEILLHEEDQKLRISLKEMNTKILQLLLHKILIKLLRQHIIHLMDKDPYHPKLKMLYNAQNDSSIVKKQKRIC